MRSISYKDFKSKESYGYPNRETYGVEQMRETAMSTNWSANWSRTIVKYKLDVGEFLIMLYEIKWND
jgi:hypothetical protein